MCDIWITKTFFNCATSTHVKMNHTLNVLHYKNKLNEMKRKSVSLCKLLRLKQQFERETINSCDLPQFVTIFRDAKNIWELLRFTTVYYVRMCV